MPALFRWYCLNASVLPPPNGPLAVARTRPTAVRCEVAQSFYYDFAGTIPTGAGHRLAE